jgi:hypothetical protein
MTQKKIGFVFLFSNQLSLKPYSEENKEKYKTKILLHSLGVINHVFSTKSGVIKSCFIKEYENRKSIPTLVNNEFNINKSYIVDYTPLPKQLFKNKDKKLTVYAIILDDKKEQKIIENLKSITNTTVHVDRMLLTYNLDSIVTETPDIFTAIYNYSKGRTQYERIINLSYITDSIETTYTITLMDIIEGIRGMEEIRQETKCYI